MLCSILQEIGFEFGYLVQVWLHQRARWLMHTSREQLQVDPPQHQNAAAVKAGY